MSEPRFAGWNPYDDSHIKNVKDVQDKNINIEQVFEPEDCTMYNENYGTCHDYPCNDCVTRFIKNYKEEEHGQHN